VDKKEVHNKEVKLATAYLLNAVIPKFARKLNHGIIKIKNGVELIEHLHKDGINIRHLGIHLLYNIIIILFYITIFFIRYLGKLVLYLTDERYIRIVLLEMVARVLKNELRSQFRSKLEETHVNSLDESYAIVVDLLNLALGTGPASDKFWEYSVYPKLIQQFPSAHFLETTTMKGSHINTNNKDRRLSTPAQGGIGSSSSGLQRKLKDLDVRKREAVLLEKTKKLRKSLPLSHIDIRESIDNDALLQRFLVLTGVRLSADFFNGPKKDRVLVYTDIEALEPTVSSMNVVHHAEGMQRPPNQNYLDSENENSIRHSVAYDG